jgi:hypothetical protein
MTTEDIEEDAYKIMDILEDMVLSSGNRYAEISQWRERCRMDDGRWRAAARYLADNGHIHRQGKLVAFGCGE